MEPLALFLMKQENICSHLLVQLSCYCKLTLRILTFQSIIYILSRQMHLVLVRIYQFKAICGFRDIRYFAYNAFFKS